MPPKPPIVFRLDDDVRSKLSSIAEHETGGNLSVLLRKLIDEGLATRRLARPVRHAYKSPPGKVGAGRCLSCGVPAARHP